VKIWLLLIFTISVLRFELAAVGQTALSQQPDPTATPIVITLEEAINRAETIDPGFATAFANRGAASLDRSIARSALLPQAIYHNQYVYTQPNGEAAPPVGSGSNSGSTVQTTPKFIASNGVREYASQAVVSEAIGLQQVAGYRRAGALAVQATAQLEAARRGLIAAVVDAYYGLLAADRKLEVATRSLNEAHDFQTLSEQLEAGREVAHSDVVKASLQTQQRERDLADATLAASRARLDLGVLLFPDPRTPYKLQDDTDHSPVAPLRAEVEAAASKNNPDLNSAISALRAADQDVTIAKGGYIPNLLLNYTYGIDAPEFAVNGQGSVRNLGYSASVTLDIPVWDWLATRDRVKQSELRRKEVTTTLNYTQRKLMAQLEEFYSETRTSGDALISLERSVMTARESLRLTKLRYKAGEATVLEVVDAQNVLLGVEMSLADGIVRYRLALANLQTLTGNMP
jgi:outer membrane protein TolC